MAPKSPDSRNYVLISSDGHAGASIRDYKPYLAKEFHEDFEPWAASFHDPWAEYDKELADTDDVDLRIGVASASSPYNWESERRLENQDDQGIAAEVLYPNTVPPFYPSGAVTASAPRDAEEYRYHWAGVQAHNRWLVDFCAKAPDRRAGLAQVFLNDIDDAIAEVRWARKAGLRGVIIPSDHQSKLVNLYELRLDPFWKACCEEGMPVHRHSISVGPPETAETGPAAVAIGAYETHSMFQRGLSHLLLGGVFERFPDLQVVFAETGTAWVGPELRRLDGAAKVGTMKGHLGYSLYHRTVEMLSKAPSEYFARNVHIAPSLAVGKDMECRYEIGVDRIMWGADYPHHEGSYPHNKLAVRLLFNGIPEDEVRKMTSINAAKVYGLDLDKLQKIADRIGPTVEEVTRPVVAGDLPAAAFSHTVSEAIHRLRPQAAA